MSFSLGGGQLPLSAFFGSSASSSKRPTKIPTGQPSSKRKDPATRDRAVEPANKKRKHKENLTPSGSRGDSCTRIDRKHDEMASSSQLEPSPRQLDLGEGVRRSGDRNTPERMNKALGDGTSTNILSKGADMDLTLSGSDEDIPTPKARTARLPDTPPLTPEVRQRHRDIDFITSLPSPPLTAPDAKRRHQVRDKKAGEIGETLVQLRARAPALQEEDAENSRLSRSAYTPKAAATGFSDSGVGDKGPPASHGPLNSQELMPPPPLPLKLLPTTMAALPPRGRKLRSSSTSSDRWVPSSQTQELSIPRPENEKAEVSQTVSERMSQVVPSSQAEEMELQMPCHSSEDAVIHEPPLSPLVVDKSLNSSFVLQSIPAERGRDGSSGMPSPEVVESSQSQFEAEITSAHAETIVERYKAIGWLEPVETGPSMTPSSPPRSIDPRGYEAQDEYSSQDPYSPQSTFTDPRTSPLSVPSQSSELFILSGSYADDSHPHNSAPLRRFKETFEGRDENGNVLPEGGRSPRTDGQSQEKTTVYSRSQDMPDMEVDHDPLDYISGSPLNIPKDEDYASAGGSSYGSSFSETMPTPLRNFLEMFSQDEAEPDAASQDPEDTPRGF